MTAGECPAEPNGHRPRTGARVGRALAIGAALVLAVAGGFGGALGAAAVTARPAVFLTCGAAMTALLGGAGLWATLRNLPRVPRIWAVALLLGALEVIGAVAVLTPMGGRTPAPVDGVSFWRLGTGSRLAYVRIPGVAPRRPTPVVVLHGGPGVPDMAGDAAYFGKLSTLGYDVYVYDQLGSGRSTRLADPAGYGVERDVADLDAVRRAIGAGRMILVGHSAGGALAAHYLAAHPTGSTGSSSPHPGRSTRPTPAVTAPPPVSPPGGACAATPPRSNRGHSWATSCSRSIPPRRTRTFPMPGPTPATTPSSPPRSPHCTAHPPRPTAACGAAASTGCSTRSPPRLRPRPTLAPR
jgi:pimeloyl-ACP methyl ester carboxylesterase